MATPPAHQIHLSEARHTKYKLNYAIHNSRVSIFYHLTLNTLIKTLQHHRDHHHLTLR